MDLKLLLTRLAVWFGVVSPFESFFTGYKSPAKPPSLALLRASLLTVPITAAGELGETADGQRPSYIP